jgi:HSP20 family protein
MKSLIPSRHKRKELAGRTGQLFPLLPFGDFEFSLSRMREEFDRYFDRLAKEFSAFTATSDEGWNWELDVEDEDENVVVRAEAPGFDAADFDVRVEDSQLVLRASKKVETKDEKGKVKEYREQECYESVALPSGIEKEKVVAKYHNGVLTVTLPKSAESKAKRITVKQD